MANTFETLPLQVAEIDKKLEKLLALSEVKPDRDFLMTIEQLMDYLPERPARQTIYGKVNDRLIPFEKHGKRLYFRKSTIDTWLSNGRQMNAIVKPLK
jgi:phosphorylcholine metabolism protein LicD